MQIYELVIEITRKCNAFCQHCLRGNAQNKNISNDTIDKMLEGVTYISMVTFSGGEPTLAVDRIRYFLEVCKERDIEIGNCFMYTNGMIASRELVSVLTDLYAYCTDNEATSLIISRDVYHQEAIEDVSEADKLYKSLSFYRNQEQSDRHDPQLLINEGRAMGLGGRDAYLSELVVGEDDDGNPETVEGTVFVNVNGDIISSCDMSYESQEKNKMGNVHEQSLCKILTAEVV